MTTCDVAGCKESAQRVTVAQVVPVLNHLFSADLCQRHADQVKRTVADIYATLAAEQQRWEGKA